MKFKKTTQKQIDLNFILLGYVGTLIITLIGVITLNLNGVAYAW